MRSRRPRACPLTLAVTESAMANDPRPNYQSYDLALPSTLNWYDPVTNRAIPVEIPQTQLTSAPNRARPTDSKTAPLTLAGYEILDELGRGGMGVVYKARQLAVHRLVALKMILAGAQASPQELQRFRNEAQALGRLKHPGIVQVYEVGEQEGRPYFSMEFCPGGSLKDRIEGTPRPPQEAAHTVEQLARAMAAAHQAQILHRDLKPANVLVSEDGTLKISDFGLAKKLDEEGQTHSGAIMGTPSYMAPEQAGEAKTATPAVDIYALGAILYELLTGRPPFKGATAMETLLQVVSTDAVSPSQLQPTTPRDLETICLKCLHKEPGRRYPSALALADDLKRFQAGEPIAARPISRVERVWRWGRRNPAIAGLIAAVFLALLLGTVVSTSLAFQARASAERATNEAEAASAARDRADHEAENALASARQVQERGYLSDMLAVQRCIDQRTIPTVRELLERHRPEKTDGIDRRRLEWYYWWNESHRETLTLETPGGELRGFWLSPDEKEVRVVNEVGVVTKWDLSTRQKTTVPLTRGLPIPLVVITGAFRPDGKQVEVVAGALGAGGFGVELFDADTGKALPLKAGLAGISVHALCFSPDGKQLAICAPGDPLGGGFATPIVNAIKIWDTPTGRLLYTLKPSTELINCVAYSGDGNTILAGDSSGSVHLWNAKTGKEVRVLKGGEEAIHVVTTTPDDKMVLAGGEGFIQSWETKSGMEGRRFKVAGTVNALTCSPKGQFLASAGTDRTITIRDLSMGHTLCTLLGHTDSVRSVVYSRDGSKLFSCAGEEIKVWPVPDTKAHPLGPGLNWTGSCTVSPNGRTMVTQEERKTLSVWDCATWKKRLTLAAPPIRELCFSPDGTKLLGSAENDKLVHVWNLTTGKEEFTFGDGKARPFGLLVSPDSRHGASATENGSVEIVDLANGTLVATLTLTNGARIHTLTYNPSGTILVTSSGTAWTPGDVHLWDTQTWREVGHWKAHTREIFTAAFSPNGKLLATGGSDRTVRIWDTATWKELHVLRTSLRPIQCLCWTPDGERLLSGGFSLDDYPALGEVRVWETHTFLELACLTFPDFQVSQLWLTAERKRVVVHGSGWTSFLEVSAEK